ncbi:MAG: shikimate dehydrogenase [Gemmatimonadales bacterium]|jgi:shikimate dehydrogenase
MRIRATTRLLAVLGDPIAQSLSPAMHNAAIGALGLDAVFVALRASPAELETVIQGLLAAGGAACVTVPHKQAAAELLDEPSELVRRTGACNTIWRQDGAVVGDNTDVAGVSAEARRLMAGKPVRRALLLGTGGSARAAAVAIADAWAGADVAVSSRDGARGAEFASWAQSAGVRCSVWGGGGAANGERADLVVNATPLGLRAGDPSPLEAEALRRVAPAAVLDLVYARGGTTLVREARAAGAAAADGRGVLVAQGAAAFRLFLGVEAPVEIMRAAVEDALGA